MIAINGAKLPRFRDRGFKKINQSVMQKVPQNYDKHFYFKGIFLFKLLFLQKLLCYNLSRRECWTICALKT